MILVSTVLYSAISSSVTTVLTVSILCGYYEQFVLCFRLLDCCAFSVAFCYALHLYAWIQHVISVNSRCMVHFACNGH